MESMKDNLPPGLPITGVCIVADLSRVPAGYKAIDRSYDKYEDADVWKDSFFAAKKVYRYFCISREIKNNDVIGSDVVLADISLINERESVPPGFAPIDQTIDTRDKATKGKRVVIKLIPRDSTNDGICELIILSKNKRPPGDYTLVGEMNGMALCFRMGPVPKNPNARKPVQLPYAFPGQISQPGGTAYWNGQQHYNQREHGYTEPLVKSQSVIQVQQAPPDARLLDAGYQPYDMTRATTLQRHFATSPLSGVPFEIDKRMTKIGNPAQAVLPNIEYKTIMNIENEFEYNFTLEKSVRSRSPST